MMEKGVALLVKYNESGNATIDYFNTTDSFGKKWGQPSCLILKWYQIPRKC